MKYTEQTRKKNLNVFTFSNILFSYAVGLFGPGYLIFINEMGGGIENFGFALGLIALSGALTYLIFGKYSDRIGRKPLLIIGGYASALIVLLYTLIDLLWQLCLVQILSGFIVALFEISEEAFLGDETRKDNRGSAYGKYYAILGIVEAIAIFSGGMLAEKFSFKIMAYIIAAICIIATSFMLKISERRSKWETR
ncbi:hypothetical protein A3K73_00615 [Candidatus Pacearchaeota archaeon RBG_13_36_9]|nr:MAG: hypothetical protein A3K73_00615 [Candidatus Pacearchaeota archaeon RBG_13_36_9]